MPAPIRVALLGYGLAGAVFHAPLIAEVEGLELAAIVTRDYERSSRARRDHPDAALLSSPEEVWERAGELDLVVVAAANRAHFPLARSSIDAGLAVVVDKPLVNMGVSVIQASANSLVDPWLLGSKDERDVQGYAGTPVNQNDLMIDYLFDIGAAGVAFPLQKQYYVAVDSGSAGRGWTALRPGQPSRRSGALSLRPRRTGLRGSGHQPLWRADRR